MTELVKNIIMVASGLVGGLIFVLIKNKVFKTTKQEVIRIIPEEDKQKVKELFEKGLIPEKVYKEVCSIPESIECFSKEKAITGLTKINSKVLWMKDISSIFNLRKLIIIGVIIGCIFGYGYWRGRIDAPVKIDLKGKEALIQLNEHFLKIDKDGTATIIDKDGKVLKVIKVKDIDGLRQALRPYGFRLKPFVTAGGGLGTSGVGWEAGAGVDFFKWFKTNANAFLTNKGIYLGIGYQLTDNFDVLIGAGKGYREGDTRIYIGGKWRF